jgi:hypothetical protein
MRKISVFVALLALFFTDLALAVNIAVSTSVTGTVQVQTGTTAARPLRQGDEVAQGDTIITGANSSVVLKFDDGQVAAMTSNSRMTITAYQYNPATESGNVLLSLISGGMRAITGVIGRRTPDRVAYRVASATIGIRGTDVTTATANGQVIAHVTEGSISFTMNGQTIIIPTGQAVHAKPDGSFSRGAIAALARDLQAVPGGQAVLDFYGSLANLSAAINAAAPGVQRQGQDGAALIQGQQNNIQGGNVGGAQGGGGGGTRPSGS